MNEIYHTIGISKQAFHQHLDRRFKHMEEHQQLLPVIRQIREDHPRMSAREMYRLIQPQHIGRDCFIAFCFDNGYRLEIKRAFHRTTDSSGVIRFDNLIAGREFTGINQAWVSDITYYRLGEKFFYLTFITDLCSRRIVGYSVSDNLMTEHTTLPALKMALSKRNSPKRLILHSDGGGQYYSKTFTDLTKAHKIQNSMAENIYENPHAERLNGTIKNDYVIPYGPQDFKQLKQMVKKAVDMYNLYRPHKALKGMAPAAYEKLLKENGNSFSVSLKKKRDLEQTPFFSSANPACSLRFPITSHAGKVNTNVKKRNKKQKSTSLLIELNKLEKTVNVI